MRKIIVIGCPGSGKSTFARELHARTGIPLYHLDMLYWNADRTAVDREVFLARLTAVLERDAWIIDGNYASTMELRMAACDTVIFLDYSPEVCLDGIQRRRGMPRADMPWVEYEEDVEFTAFVREYGIRQRPRVLSLLAKYGEKKVVIFTERTEADAFLTRSIGKEALFPENGCAKTENVL